jgi:hypothetical protein
MDKYFLLEATELLDGTTAQAVWAYDDLNTAVMTFHQSLASAMANENVKHAMRLVVDGNGMPFRTENWDRPVEPEPEPEPEPEE